jgi:xanthine dehydrogenase YagR molybdenum-binding subunit
MAEADAIVEAEYATSAQVQHALEPHCAVAQWLGDELHVHVSTQGIWDARAQLARSFGLDPDRVHVTCEYMGGGFGAKQGPTTEGLLAAYLSRAAAGRAVRVFNDRRSEAVATGHRAQTQQSYRIGATSGGVLTAIELTSVIANPMRGWINPTTIPARTLYRCANVRAQSIPLLIDVEPSNAFRAPGIMEGTFGYESALDELAAVLGMDPLELRRVNDVDVDQASGMPYSAKNLSACIDRAAELSGWAGRDALRDREHEDGRKRGLGAACQIWWGGGGPPAHALVRMGHDGVVTVVTGAQDIGTGVTTAFAMVAAEELGLPLDRVRVEVGSTRYGVFAPVSGGSQTMPSVAPAVRAAAYDLKGKLLELAGDVFEVSPEDLRIADGEFVSLDGALREKVTEVTGKLGQAQLVGTGSRGPNPEGMRVNTFGCQVAQVAVDVATGEIAVERIVAVHDIGRVISPLQARSQVEGGVLQGLGFALMEERVVDRTTGTVVNANLEDYKLPTHADCPEIVIDFIDKPDPHASSLGLKGLGEPPIVPTAPAIANAVFHATGVRVRHSPITRRRFLEERAR